MKFKEETKRREVRSAEDVCIQGVIDSFLEVRRTKAPEATPFSKYTLLVPFEVFSLEVNFAVRRTLVLFRLDCSSAAIQRAPLSIIAVTELSVRTSGPQQGRTSILPKTTPFLYCYILHFLHGSLQISHPS